MPKNSIALNVLAGITNKVKAERALDSGNVGLVVFTGSEAGLKGKIQELKELKSENIMLSLAFSFMASRILDMEHIIDELAPIEVYREEDMFQMEEIVKKYPCIIGPNITVNTLSKVALGMVDSFISALIWTYLYNGKRVYLDYYSTKNYMGRPIKNKAMEEIIDGYITALSSMGAVEIETGRYNEILNGEIDVHIDKDITKENYSLKKVITEKDLQNMPRGKHIVLPMGTIVTPLAKDTAKLMGIALEIER